MDERRGVATVMPAAGGVVTFDALVRGGTNFGDPVCAIAGTFAGR